MSTTQEREAFEMLVQAWRDYIDDEDGNLGGMVDAIETLGIAMGYELASRRGETK